MSDTDAPKNPDPKELDTAQAEGVAGGDLCSPGDLVAITASLTQSYENLVEFASHVIERVAGES